MSHTVNQSPRKGLTGDAIPRYEDGMDTLVEEKCLGSGGKLHSMWRVRFSDGALSDMFNLTRAKALLRRLESK